MNVNTPEALFVQVQDHCENITTKPGVVWLKTKKSKAAFTAGTPAQHQPVGASLQQVTQPCAPALSTQGTQPGGENCQPHQVDCNKPKDSEPHTCINKCGHRVPNVPRDDDGAIISPRDMMSGSSHSLSAKRNRSPLRISRSTLR